MIIVAGGDSFVFGSELKDQQGHVPSQSTFPALLAQGHEYRCAAWPGNANNAISRMTMAACAAAEQPVAVVTWTFLQRYEFHFNYSTQQKLGHWQSINSWTAGEMSRDDIKRQFVNNNDAVLDAHLQNLKTAKETGTADFAREFFMHVGNSEYYELYHSLKEFVFLQNYFKVNRIPYLMLAADNHFYQHENFVRSRDKYLDDLYDQIDWTRWYFFPAGTAKDETVEPRGFYQWAVENKYAIGTTHPLEQAHGAAADLLKERFNELVTENL